MSLIFSRSSACFLLRLLWKLCLNQSFWNLFRSTSLSLPRNDHSFYFLFDIINCNSMLTIQTILSVITLAISLSIQLIYLHYAKNIMTIIVIIIIPWIVSSIYIFLGRGVSVVKRSEIIYVTYFSICFLVKIIQPSFFEVLSGVGLSGNGC